MSDRHADVGCEIRYTGSETDMGIFDGKKKGASNGVEEEKIKFFTPTEYDYTIPDSRKPIVVKKEAKKSASKTKSAAKKTDTKAKKSAAKKDETKKSEVKKPVAKSTAPKAEKAVAKKSAVKSEAKKPMAKEAKKPTAAVAKKADIKKPATKKAETKKPTKKVTETVEITANETVTVGKAMRSGTFDIKKSKDGRYVFNLYSANKVIIATSQVYSSSQAAMTGVKSVMTNATKAEIEDTTLKAPVEKPYPKWEIYVDRAGEYRFRLNASNATCICHAKAGYSTKSSCKRGIESIIRLAEDAQIDKSYLGDKK